MKEISTDQADKELGSNCFDHPLVRTVDWKDNPNEVLEKVNKQLAEHGLEIVSIDTGSDMYAWYIKRKA
jgi:hypothetical protein